MGRLSSALANLPAWLPRRPRNLLAFVLIVLVAVIVGLGKLFGDDPALSTAGGFDQKDPTGSATSVAVDPASGDDGVAAPQLTPSALQPSGGPEAIAVATAFAKSWLQIDRGPDGWLAALLPHCTQNLADSLAGVDPANVPASRITGDASLEAHASTAVDVTIPMDAGLLRLRLLAQPSEDGEYTWLVDGIDWERA